MLNIAQVEAMVAALFREAEHASPARTLTLRDAADALLVVLDTTVAEEMAAAGAGRSYAR